MKNQILVLPFLIVFTTTCSKPPVIGEVVNVTSSQNFQAKYLGQDLKVGDKVLIYQEVKPKLTVNNEKRNDIPFKEKKSVIGKGIVMDVLSNNYYEIKADNPQYIPNEDAYIQKL